MSFAEIPPTCTNPINIIQTQTPKHIAKKQAKLFLPNFGFLRPIKYKAAADRRSPELRAKTTGMRRNNASIFWTSGRRAKSHLKVRIHAPQLLTLSSAILSNQPSVSSSSEPPHGSTYDPTWFHTRHQGWVPAWPCMPCRSANFRFLGRQLCKTATDHLCRYQQNHQ